MTDGILHYRHKLMAFANERLDETAEAMRRIEGRRFYACDDGHVEEPQETWADGGDRLPNHHNSWSPVLDPAQVMRDTEFKRALLLKHSPVPFWGNNPPPLKDRTAGNIKAWYCECQCPDGVIEGEYPCETAKLIVSVWDDDPGYEEAWKP